MQLAKLEGSWRREVIKLCSDLLPLLQVDDRLGQNRVAYYKFLLIFEAFT